MSEFRKKVFSFYFVSAKQKLFVVGVLRVSASEKCEARSNGWKAVSDAGKLEGNTTKRDETAGYRPFQIRCLINGDTPRIRDIAAQCSIQVN